LTPLVGGAQTSWFSGTIAAAQTIVNAKKRTRKKADRHRFVFFCEPAGKTGFRDAKLEKLIDEHA